MQLLLIKIILPFCSSIQYILDEMNAFRCINHPNIVKCHGFRMSNFQSLQIMLEYVHGRTIDQEYEIYKSEEILFYWIFQLSLALIELQKNEIVHRDIKPKNILINSKGLVKIIDFGVSKFLSNNHSEIVGSPSYIAPEILAKNYVSYSSDVWSLGVTLYQLTHSKLPFNADALNQNELKQTYSKIINQKVKVNSVHCSEQLRLLILAMLKKDPTKRIKASSILKYPCIQKRKDKFTIMYQNSLIA